MTPKVITSNGFIVHQSPDFMSPGNVQSERERLDSKTLAHYRILSVGLTLRGGEI